LYTPALWMRWVLTFVGCMQFTRMNLGARYSAICSA
jgi:hypothetical protein